MPFDTYANFRTQIYNNLGGVTTTDVTTTSIDDIVRIGEEYIFEKLRVQEMEKALAVTLTSAGNATLPSDYVDAQYLYLNRSPNAPLTKKSAEWIFRTYPDRTATGIPKFVAESAGAFIFGPASDDTTNVVQGVYYAKTLLSTGSTINSVFSAYPQLYLWAALANAEPYLGREQRFVWQQKTDAGIARANQKQARRKFGGSPVASSPG